MRKSLAVFLTGLAVICFAQVERAAAQNGGDVLQPTVSTGFLLGPVGGINAVAYNSAAFPIINSEKDCFTAQNGSDIAPWVGFTLEFPLSDKMQQFIIGEVIYDSKSSKFTALNGSKLSTLTKANGYQAPGSVATALTSSLNYLLVDLAFKYNFTEGPSPVGPGIQIGPSIGIKMTSNFNKTVTVQAASGKADGDIATQTVSQTSAIDGASALRIALRAQATYDIPFTQTWIMTPTVGYDFPITKVDNTTRSWMASSVYAGVAFRYFLKGL